MIPTAVCPTPAVCSFGGCMRPDTCATHFTQEALTGAPPHLVERARDAGAVEPFTPTLDPLDLTEEMLVSSTLPTPPAEPPRMAPAGELRIMRVAGIGPAGSGWVVGLQGGAPIAVAASAEALGAVVATWARGG